MERKRKNRYVLAVYAVVLFLAVALASVSFYLANHHTWQSIVLNLATDLIGVALAFFRIPPVPRR